ncbi:hypothetical protein [Novispirillum itersonii]|uniref:Uncharacterized protein n=1 Tax=Novispirillum itersonii TaxID=189 RepID=A0A7X0DNL0_NOVIT|nr:hypothetical protein [Novispirillum itersonii]MBB6212085.1 hypothetical protein [Novispirillum itersonii]
MIALSVLLTFSLILSAIRPWRSAPSVRLWRPAQVFVWRQSRLPQSPRSAAAFHRF